MATELIKARRNSVIAVNLDSKIDTISATTEGREVFEKTEEMLVRRIEKVILGQTLTSGTDGGSGNRALGEVHNAVRQTKIFSDIEMVRSTIQHFVDVCFRLNGFTGKPPELVYGDDRDLSVERGKRDVSFM